MLLITVNHKMCSLSMSRLFLIISLHGIFACGVYTCIVDRCVDADIGECFITCIANGPNGI